MDYTALAKHRVNLKFNQVKGRKMKPALALSTVLLLAAASPMVAENDGNVCELPGTQCRALETAVVGPRLNGQTVDQGYASFPSVYFDNGTMYMSAHAFFLPNWRPPGLTLCSTVLGDQIETGALWMKTAVSASNITQPFSFVRRISPCRNEINGEIDPLRGAENGGGGNGTEIEKGFNGLYYTLSSTFFEKHPYNMNQVCDDWNQGCFPGIYIGAQASPTAMPEYMLARLLSIYDFGGARRGFQGIRLAPFNDPSRPAPSAAAFPRQSFNGTPALFFGYVTWGTIIPESCPCSTARIQIVDVPDGVVRPSWASTRIFMVDNTGVWRLVPTGGRPDFVPETLVDTTGFNEFLKTPSPFYDSGQGGWRNAMDWNYLPSGTTGCNEVSRSGFEGGNSTVAHRAVDGSGFPVIFDFSTSTTNGFQLGVEIFRIPGAGPQWYLARGSTERICFGNQAWWHPFLGSEITIEKVSPPIAVVSGTYGANCGAALGNKTAHLATSCNGQESCPYAVNWQTLGDPAPGCAKDYAARWTCGGAGPTFLYTLPPEAGLGSIANLTCQAPVITVVAGSYGTNCNPAAAGNRTAALVAACSGRTSCNYTVNHQILGDPYPGCAKNYRAEWKCGASATVLSHVLPPEAGFGSVANLVCN